MQRFYKNNGLNFIPAVRTFIVLLLTAVLPGAVFAQNFTVTNTADGHGTNQLRGAIEASDLAGGTHVITVNPGTYTLTLGEITFGTHPENITINGAGAASTIISMTGGAGRDRIFFINPDGTTNSPVISVSGLTFQNGYLTSDIYGGAAICAGGGAAESLTISNCVFNNNTIPANDYGGAAVCMQVRGNLSIDNSTFTNNVSNDADGGAVLFIIFNSALGTSYGTLSVTNSTFDNNSVVFPGAGASNGGALAINGQAGITPFGATVTNNTFTNNSADGYGGGISTDNGVAGVTYQIHFNRFTGNTAGASALSSGLQYAEAAGNVNADNNWWGCNSNPVGASSTAPCDQAGGDVAGGGALVLTKWIQLKTTANPTTICNSTPTTLGNTSAITTSFLTNSAGETLTTGNLSRVIGLPVTWTATKGTLSLQQTTIQAAGTATATFTSDGTGGTATVNAQVDDVPASETTPARANITVNITSVAPTGATGITTVCNGTGTTLTVAGGIKGTGAVTEWFTGSCGGTLVFTGDAYSTGNLAATTTYYVRYNGTCNTTTCATVTVTVNDVTAGGVGSDQTICSGGDPAAFTESAASTGSGALTYQWQSSTTSCAAGFSNIGGATSNTYDPPTGLLTTTYYHRVTTSTLNGVQCTAISNCVTVTVNNVTGGTVGSDQTICSGGDPAAFTQSAVSTGSGALTYQWQSSTTSCAAGFSDIAGATSTTYDPPTGLATTTYYHRVTTSTLNTVACTATSNCITVFVNSVTAGTVGSDQTICSGGDPAAFTQSAASTGAGALTYQWQKSTTSCAAGFSDIAGATATTYDPPAGLVTTTYYHRVTTSTLNAVQCTATSNCITVTVNSVTGGTVGSDQTLCSGGDPAAFTESAVSSGAGALTYQWQISTTSCAAGFSDIAGATGTTYDAPAGLLTTTYYHRVTTSTLNSIACTATSNCITVSVNNVTGGTVGINQAICPGGDPNAFTQSAASTGSGALTYQWQSSTTDCASGFSDIAGATGTVYDAPAGLAVTTYYHRVTTSTLNAVTCTATGNCITVTVNPTNTATLTSAAGTDAQTVLINTAIVPITYATTGATGITFSGLPPGVSASWAANVITISGTPTSSGLYNYTITLTGGCGVVTATGSINVVVCGITLTSGAGSNNAAACLNTAVTPITYSTNSATGASFSGLPPGVSGAWAANVFTISGIPTTTGVFNYTITPTGGGCTGIVTATGTITVSPIPATPTSTPGGPTTFCAGGSVTLTSSSATGNQWYLNGNPIGGATGQTYVATASGNYTVTVTASGCPSAPSAATVVTVNPIPATPTVTPGGPTTFCTGGTVTLTSSSATGNQWYLDGNPMGGETAQTYVVGVSGNVTVVVTQSACSSAPSAPTTVTVNPIPATPTSTPGGPTTFCAGGSVTLTSSSVTGNQWFLNGNPIGGATNQNYIATANGNYTVTVTSLGCSSAPSAATAVTVNPIPATPTITPGGPTTFCAGGSVTLTSSAASGNQWFLNGNPIGGATNQNYSATANGNYTVVVTSLGCSSAPSSATVVTVNPIPATPTITPGGPTTFCAGGSVTLTSSAASGNQWFLNGNPIGGATTQNYSATANGNYTVVVTSLGCSSAPSSATVVTVNPIPATPTITPGGPTTFCAGGSVTLTSSAASGNQWYLNGNPIGGATAQTFVANANGNYTVIVTSLSCSSAPSSATAVAVNAVTGGAVAGDQAICPGGDPVAFTQTTASTGSGVLSYQWQSSTTDCVSGFSDIAGATGIVYDVPAGLVVTTYYHRVTTSTLNTVACTATGNCITVTVNPINTITLTSAAGTDAQTVLINTPITNITYTTTGATSVAISGLPPGIGISGSPSAFTFSGSPTASGIYNYQLTLNGGCGTVTATGSINVIVCSITRTSAAGTDAQVVCINSAITNIIYSTTGATGATFSGLPAGVTGTWAANVVTISGTPSAFGTFNYIITPTGGGCGGGITATGTITVNPTPVGSATAQTICSGGTTSVTLNSTTPVAGTTYSYTAAIQTTPTGGTITGQAAGSANPIAQTLTNTGTTAGVIRYTVTPTYTNAGQACTGASFTVDVTVNPNPTGSAAAQTICSGGTTSVTLNANTPAAGTTYSYTAAIQTTPTGGTITGQAAGSANPIAQTLTNTGTTAGVIRYTVTPTYTNAGQACTGASFTVDVTVNPNPTGSAAAQTICSGGTTSVTLNANTPAAGTTYSYTAAIQTTPTGGTITGQAAGSANPIAQTLTNTGTTFGVIRYTVTPTYTNAGQACAGASFTVDVTVNPNPTGSAAAQTICSGGTTSVTLNANTPAAGTTYSYTAAIQTTPTGGTITGQAAGSANPIAQTLTNTGTTAGVIRYTVTPTYTNAGQACTGASFAVDVTVNPNPTGSATAQTICSGGTTSVTLNANTPAAGTTYSYTAAIQTTPTGGTITGQAAGSANPIAQTLTNTGTTAGVIRYTVTPTYTNAGQSCTGASFTVDVTVNPNPTGSATAQTICSGGTTSVTLNANTPAAGTTYAYTAAIQTTPTGGTITGQAAGSANPIAQTLTNTGTTAGVIRYTVTPTYTNAGQACTGASFTVDVTVNPNPTGSATAQTICSGGTTSVTLNANTPAAGTTYSYTAAIQTTPTGGTITGQAGGSANPIAQTLINTGTTAGVIRYTVTPTYTNAGQSCTGASFTVDVTVNPNPVGSATAQTICSGSTTSVTLNANTPAAGTTYSYTAAIQTAPTGGTITGQAPGTVNPIAQTLTNTGNTAGVIRYTVTPTYTNAGQSCTGASFTVDVTVNPNPVGSATAQTICSGGTTSVTLNANTPAAGTTYSYTAAIQTTPTGGTITSQASGTANPIAQTLTNTGTTFGVIRYTVTPTYTNAGQACTGASFTVDVTVNPKPTGSASPQTICNGATTNVALSATTPAAGTTYTYTAAIQTTPAGGTITGQASGTANPIAQTLTNTGTSPGVIRYTVTPIYTNAGQACAGPTFTVDVTVNPTATVTPVSNQTLCHNTSTAAVTFSSPTTGGTIVYNWTNNTPSIGLAASGTGNIPSFIATNTGAAAVTATITVTPSYTNGSVTCTGTPFSFTITVNTLSSAPTGATASSTQLCGSGYITLTAQGGFLGTGASYKWYSGSCGGTLVGTGQVLANVYAYQTATYYVRIEGTCNTTTCQSVTVNVDPQPVVVITAVPTTSSNPNHPVKVYATVSPAGNNYTYQWFHNGIAIPGHPGDTLNIPASGTGDYYVTVTALPSGCTAQSNTLNIHDSVTHHQLFIQPNPNNGIFTVSAYASPQEIGTTRSVIVMDGSGRRVFAHVYPVTVAYDLMDVNLYARPKGAYTVTVLDSSGKVIASAVVMIGSY